MFSTIAKWLIPIALFCHAGSALAIFDVQALVGKKWYEWKADGESQGMQATSLGVAAHLSPIPFVPVSFGVAGFMHNIRKDDWPGIDEASIVEAGLDVQAWLPMVPMLTPYLRLNYPLYSIVTAKGKTGNDQGNLDVTMTGKLTGFNLSAGAKLSLIPLLSVIVEVGKGMQQITLDEWKVDGKKTDIAGDKDDFGSDLVLVGIEFGL